MRNIAIIRRYNCPQSAVVLSIHAPAGGATLCGLKTPLIMSVSIHAPAGGATAGLSEVEKQADTMPFLRCEQTRNSILVVLDLFGVLIA